MTKRSPKETDQENVKKAINLIIKTICANKEIDAAIWCSAMTSVLVDAYLKNGISSSQFLRDMFMAFEFYEKSREE